jgi:hypothetical protein
MATVILDPGLLAFVPSVSRSELLGRVELLAGWSKFAATQKSIGLALSPAVAEMLASGDLIPAYEPAKRVLALTGLGNVFSPEDLIRPVYSLLESALPISYCCVTEELHEAFDAHPPQPWHGADPIVEGMSQRALVLSFIENELHGGKIFQFFASVLSSEKVNFSARISEVEPNSTRGFTDRDLPKTIDYEFRHVRSMEDISTGLDPDETWASATSAADLKFAIQLGCRRRMLTEGTYTGLSGIPTFWVGGDFLLSLKAWQADSDNRFARSTLEACVAAVLGLPTIEVKPFRKSKRAVDLASPLRAHISKGGVGLRLMMWLRPGGHSTLEFANVGGKNEEEISYSDPANSA